MTLQAVSKHLGVLEDAGLVSKTRTGQQRIVHLEAEVFDLMTKWIDHYQKQAEQRYQRLDAVLVELNETARPAPHAAAVVRTDRKRKDHAS
jgi:DNA-binding transcriptional ArsR family regulator